MGLMFVMTQNKGGLLVNEEFSVPEIDFYKKHTQKTGNWVMRDGLC
jgi:hypothetical protein